MLDKGFIMEQFTSESVLSNAKYYVDEYKKIGLNATFKYYKKVFYNEYNIISTPGLFIDIPSKFFAFEDFTDLMNISGKLPLSGKHAYFCRDKCYCATDVNEEDFICMKNIITKYEAFQCKVQTTEKNSNEFRLTKITDS
ncbi:hypothetical protein PVAND_011003 [Polypedilum vanderplanki]|uniref:Uncharacterized protein n=1 Tax=Polypedilum vanderplanki TaxID=319348 RepID=A0A9J6CIP1_POLVA|nr:hypothetical protein PVAND_011003 [Polypedilum vanderplanki]